MEDYPSPAEGNGLENRQAGKTVQGFESLILLFHIIAGWSSLVARRAHNPSGKTTAFQAVVASSILVTRF